VKRQVVGNLPAVLEPSVFSVAETGGFNDIYPARRADLSNPPIAINLRLVLDALRVGERAVAGLELVEKPQPVVEEILSFLGSVPSRPPEPLKSSLELRSPRDFI
jgi:hypothetical protein